MDGSVYPLYICGEKGKVIANASGNIIDTIWKGTSKWYIQISTIMTIRHIENRDFLENWWKFSPIGNDCIYLFVNDTVLDFYPRFGFIPAKEYQYETLILATKQNLLCKAGHEQAGRTRYFKKLLSTIKLSCWLD